MTASRPRKSSGRRTSSWPRAIYSQDSLQSGPRIYGGALGIGGTVADIDAWPQRIGAVTPAAVVAAARHVWRADGLGDLGADAAGRHAVRQLLRFLAALVVAVSGLPAAAGAVDIKTITHAARHQGLAGAGQERARRVAVLFLRRRHGVGSRGPAGRHHAHGHAAQRRRRNAHLAGLPAAAGGCRGIGGLQRLARPPGRQPARAVGQPRGGLRAAAAGAHPAALRHRHDRPAARPDHRCDQPGHPASGLGRRGAR